jgi:DNA polymerase-3 subunit gamma/tau
MSYQVLARKYRPRSFETLVGQEHVVRALTHALDQKRLHHAWLFTGTRGVGKTTLSRILAKALNCQGADGQGDVTAQPCGVCDACTAIDVGRFVDYIEMDAASNRGVDEMAQLLEQAIYAPSNARYKVYMIDEVHMLSSHAFNAMLKTLEEPPEHVKFILATTDPQKIPVTVLSRCLQFNLKQMPPGHIVGHLENILGQEQISFEGPALRLLAQGAQGSMRDALSLTDQAIAYSAGQITLDAVQGMLGALDQSYLLRVLDALARGEGADLLVVADEMAARSLSWSTALQDLGSLLHRIALAQAVPAALAADLPEREEILRLAGVLQPDEVQLYYQIAVHGRNELGLAPDEYAGFTMTLLRMLAFRPVTGGGPGKQEAATAPKAGSTSRPAQAASNAAIIPRSTATAAEALAAPTGSARSPAAAAAAAARPAAPAAPATTATAGPPSALPASAANSASRAANSPARAALEAARGLRNSTAMRPPAPVAAMPAPAPARAAAPTPAPTPGQSPAAASRPARAVRESEAPAPWDDVIDGAALAMLDVPVFAEFEPVELEVREPGATYEVAPREATAAPATRAAEPVIVAPPVLDIPGWQGDWPSLAAALPLRGVVQQLALQSELLRCQGNDSALDLHLRLPVDTLRSAGSPEKLAAALTEKLGRRVNLSTEVGAVTRTASILAAAAREERLRSAEQSFDQDPFVQALNREFGASVVPGSVRTH